MTICNNEKLPATSSSTVQHQINNISLRQVGTVLHSPLPVRLLMDDTHAYILIDCEGPNPVSAPGVGGNVPLVEFDLGR